MIIAGMIENQRSGCRAVVDSCALIPES